MLQQSLRILRSRARHNRHRGRVGRLVAEGNPQPGPAEKETQIPRTQPPARASTPACAPSTDEDIRTSVRSAWAAVSGTPRSTAGICSATLIADCLPRLGLPLVQKIEQRFRRGERASSNSPFFWLTTSLPSASITAKAGIPLSNGTSNCFTTSAFFFSSAPRST